MRDDPSPPPALGDALAHAADELLAARSDGAISLSATGFVEAYRSASDEDRTAFFYVLLEQFGPDADAFEEALEAYQSEPSPRTQLRLSECSEPKRQGFVRALNNADGGTAEILSLRSDLLEALKLHPDLASVDADFVHVLRSWFNLGFLTLARLDWDTPASVLEKLIEHEAVHEIRGWSDLRRRLADDRRCFAYFHSALPGEPVVFVEIALTSDIAGSIDEILHEAPPDIQDDDPPDTAVFYSITNCRPGLRGVPMGGSLLERVKDQLKDELPWLSTFVTLSPVPGLMNWLREGVERGMPEPFDDHERQLLSRLDNPSWPDDPELAEALEPIVLRACEEYLACVREDGQPLDPVARFHLGNGARLVHINWLGDRSTKGLQECAGVLVNYLYAGDRNDLRPHGGSAAARQWRALSKRIEAAESWLRRRSGSRGTHR